MSELSDEQRNKLKKSQFGLPGSERYPMPDKSHAANAKARASQMVKAGKLSSSSEDEIDAKANKVLADPGGEVDPKKQAMLDAIDAMRQKSQGKGIDAMKSKYAPKPPDKMVTIETPGKDIDPELVASILKALEEEKKEPAE